MVTLNWHKKTKYIPTIILLLLLVCKLSAGQENSLTKAIQLFDKGKYNAAELIFEELIKQKPDNFLINYYYGACRTENGHFSKKDMNYLNIAGQDVSPTDIHLYLGMQYHAQNDWSNALKNYNRYKLNSSPEEQQKTNLAEKLEQCFNKINPYTYVEDEIQDNIKDTITENKTIDNKVNMPKENLPEEKPETAEQNPSATDTEEHKDIVFTINNTFTYLNTSHFRTETGKENFEASELKQKELDLTLLGINEMRKKYAAATTREGKDTTGEKIIFFENKAYSLKDEITMLQFQAKKAEQEYWKNASEEDKNKMLAKIKNDKATQEKLSSEPSSSQLNQELINPDILLTNNELTLLPNKEKKEELIYKIQIGAYSRGIPAYMQRIYKKLSVIRKIDNYTDDKGVVVYTTGNLRNLEDALKMQDRVRQEGVEDAYVVPYINGKRITLEQAKQIEAGK